jgi:uncharacterized protein (TIGR02246 family)
MGTDEAEIRAVSLAWKEAFNAGDTAAVVALYADDAVLAAPGVPAVLGKAAIRDYFVQTMAGFKAAGLTVEDSPIGELRASGDLGFQWMRYRIVDTSGAVVDAGKLLTLFHRRNGRWLIVGDTWNSDFPLATGAVPPGASQPRHS